MEACLVWLGDFCSSVGCVVLVSHVHTVLLLDDASVIGHLHSCRWMFGSLILMICSLSWNLLLSFPVWVSWMSTQVTLDSVVENWQSSSANCTKTEEKNRGNDHCWLVSYCLQASCEPVSWPRHQATPLFLFKLARCPAQFARVSSFSSKLLDFLTLEKLNTNSFV